MNQKKKIILYVSALFLTLILSFFIFTLASQATEIKLDLQQPFGSLVGEKSKFNITAMKGTAIAVYIGAVYTFAAAAIVAFAILMIIIAGMQWATSAGSPEKVGQAKDTIFKSLLGLMLAVFAVFILGTINPALINFGAINPKDITTVPCCQIGTGDTAQYGWTDTVAACTSGGGQPAPDGSFCISMPNWQTTPPTTAYNTAQNCGGTDPLASCWQQACDSMTGFTRSTDTGTCPADKPNCCKQSGPLTACTTSNDPVCTALGAYYCAKSGTSGTCLPKRPLGMTCVDDFGGNHENACVSGKCFGSSLFGAVLDASCTSIDRCVPQPGQGKKGDFCVNSRSCINDHFCACAGWVEERTFPAHEGNNCNEGTCQPSVGIGYTCAKWESCATTDTTVCNNGVCPVTRCVGAAL